MKQDNFGLKMMIFVLKTLNFPGPMCIAGPRDDPKAKYSCDPRNSVK